MKAIVIGTGRMGKAIVKVLAEAYPGEIGLYSRDQEKAASLIRSLEVNAIAVTAAQQFEAPIIIHTLWYKDVLPWVVLHREALAGKILVDITNPFNDDFTDFVTDYNTSSAEEIQKLVPDTAVAGAFKNTYWVVFDQPEYNGIQSDIYVTANADTIRSQVMAFLQPIPFRIFDAGVLRNNRTIERMTLLEKELAQKAGNHPRVSFHLWGVDAR
ncbi:MAG: NAD(P)-binding domain-containing protein [Chitinophagaceae bacterium]|nr:NAD(P)-binding domain-containing protein [Chitinophagaceae bacterium]